MYTYCGCAKFHMNTSFVPIQRQISVVCPNCLPDLILQGILVIRLQEIALEDFIFVGFS